jgi:hypothetical protein
VDAFKIALETVFVGALAIPWLALTIGLFFPEANSWLWDRLKKRKTEANTGQPTNAPSSASTAEPANPLSSGEGQIATAVAGVLLTALAYLIGAGVSRLAEDFFNDDDLRISVTEDQIRKSVYCDPVESRLVEPEALSLCPCQLPCDGSKRIREIFQLQESTLLLAGADKTDRLRRQHQQLMVLRGAAFDGVLTCMLCLLGWNLKKKGWGQWRYVLPGIITLCVLTMLYSHLNLKDADIHLKPPPHPLQLFSCLRADDPPAMELTFLILGLGGFYSMWKGKAGSWQYAKGFWAAALATGLAYAGWYLTEIQYDRLVIYSFYAQTHGLLKLPAP